MVLKPMMFIETGGTPAQEVRASDVNFPLTSHIWSTSPKLIQNKIQWNTPSLDHAEMHYWSQFYQSTRVNTHGVWLNLSERALQHEVTEKLIPGNLSLWRLNNADLIYRYYDVIIVMTCICSWFWLAFVLSVDFRQLYILIHRKPHNKH